MTKKKSIGNFNPCGVAMLYDHEGKPIGSCLDTPNVFAVACLLYPIIDYGVSHYDRFADETRKRDGKDNIERMEMYRTLLRKKIDSVTAEVNAIRKDIWVESPSKELQDI